MRADALTRMKTAPAVPRPISKDAAAMWCLLAVALLIQFGLGELVQALSTQWSIRPLWAVMGTLAAALLIAAYRGPWLVLSQVFGWRGSAAGWIAFAAGVGGLCALVVRSQFVQFRPLAPDAIVIATTVGPLLEELLYRGFLWGVLSSLVENNVRGFAGTIILLSGTAVLFALMHVNPSPAYFWLRFLAGIFLGVLRLRSNTSFPSAIAHLAFNITVVS